MSNYTIQDSEHQNLRGKVIVITGAATGIGRATAQLAHRHGAKVAVCDVNEEKGKELEDRLKENILFQRCDVSNWQSVLKFFLAVYAFFGPIDAVISNAGISKSESFDDGDIASENLEAPDISVLNINTIGSFYVTKCAVHFFKKHPDTKSQLILFGSVASFFDTPPLYTYCASKGAILGLMRALRTQLPKDNITVNMIAPWMTVTAMATERMRTTWGELPANSPSDVAAASLLPILRPGVNGKSFLVHGGIITELEGKLDETQSVWLGPELDKNMREGQRRLIP